MATRQLPSLVDRIIRRVDDHLYERPSYGDAGRSGRVLIVEESLPADDLHAGGLFIWQAVEILSSQGREVSIYAADHLRAEPYATRLEALGVDVIAPTQELIPWLRANEAGIAAILVARPEIARAFTRRIRRTTRARLLYYDHDLHFVRERRRHEVTGDPEALRASVRLERTERAVIRRVDAVITPSEAELPILAAIAPNTPAFAISPFFRPTAGTLDAAQAGRGVMLLGNFAHGPNVDAARWLVGGIMPLVWEAYPDVRVRLVGADDENHTAALAGPLVERIGHVADLAAAVWSHTISAVPLRFGAGLKGKVLTSVELGAAVVTTSVGNEGIDLVDGREALIADDTTTFARAIAAMLADPNRAAQMVSAAQDALSARFSRARATESLMTALFGKVTES